MKKVPEKAVQHITAGPYSPVLEVKADKIVVISGQVAVDLQGELIGDTVQEQTKATLKNCETQLSYADCTLADVFKVNIYLTDLNNWQAMNDVYVEIMPKPLPVRTAVQAVLLPGFLVEIEMWAAKKHDYS